MFIFHNVDHGEACDPSEGVLSSPADQEHCQFAVQDAEPERDVCNSLT